MATTQNTFNGNGSNLGPFSFTFKWLESTDIKVSVGGVLKTAGTHYNLQGLNYTTKTGGQVMFTAGNAPPVGTNNIRIYRDTDDEALSAVFSSGSAIRAKDLNDNFTQNLYVTQETNNNSLNVDGSNPMVGPLNMNGFQITNLPVPAVDTNAATKKYVDDRFGNLDIPGHTRWRKVATASQTTFSGTGDYGGVLAYSPTREQVYINGALQQRGVDYAADNGTSVVFTVGLTVGDVVDIICVNNLTNSSVSNAGNITYSGQFTGQTARTVAAKLGETVSVLDFGADPTASEATNNAAIAAAITYCNTSKKTLFFPAGIYLVSTVFANIQCSIVGEPNKSVIRNTNTSTLGSIPANYFLFLFQNTPDLVLRDMIFDGQVSAIQNTYNQDPVAWNSSNYDTFYGPKGVYAYGCPRFQVENCQFYNFFWSGLRIDYSADHRVRGCVTSRNRGNFGDGFYTSASSRCSYSDCYAYDFTRIGFVTEGQDTSGSTYFRFVNCFAKYGHNSSSNYTGIEYNSGFWFENSAEVEAHNCVAIDTQSGFVVFPEKTTNPSDAPSAPYSMSFVGCRATEVKRLGFDFSSFIDNIQVTAIGCVSSIAETAVAGTLGFVLNLKANSCALLEGCTSVSHANNTNTMNLVSVSSRASSGKQPKYTISNCQIGHLNSSACSTLLTQLGSLYRGDVALFFNDSYAFDCRVENCISIAANQQLVVNHTGSVTKAAGQTQYYEFIGSNKGLYAYLNAAMDRIFIDGCDGVYVYAPFGSTSLIQNSVFSSGAYLGFPSGYSTNNNEIRNCAFYGPVLARANYTIPNSGSIVAAFRDCIFKGNLSANASYLLDLRNALTTGNRCEYIVDQCTFINTGTNGADSAAITSPFNDFLYSVAKTNNFFDTSITNFLSRNWGFGARVNLTDPAAANWGIRVTYTL
jgi:hypothetical protein